jgi:hypothetical protein
LEAEKYTKEHNDLDGYYEVRHRIGTFKSEILGEIEEAMVCLMKDKRFFFEKKKRPTIVVLKRKIIFS